MHADDGRRHPDGSIDFDFHRRRAARLRRQARRELYTRARLPVGWQYVFLTALFGAAVMAAIAFAIGTPGGNNAPDASFAGERSAPRGRG
jgi:hypothetical protein